MDADFVRGFQIEGMNVRGRIVHLTDVADRVIAAHGYPDSVSSIVGEALALVSLLGASLKFDGMITLQTRSKGALRMIVADYMTPGILRACATFDRDAVAALGPTPSFSDLAGQGSLAITIDQGDEMERFQGIVSLEPEGLAQSAVNYFERSEQIPTAIKLSAATLIAREADGKPPRPHWRAGGIIIQNLAALGGREENRPMEEFLGEDWNRAAILFGTTESHELVDPQVEPERLLYRLFHEDGVRVFDPQKLEFGCRCSAERVMSVLGNYVPDELADLVEADGAIAAKCEFCSTTYRIDPKNIGADQSAQT